MKLKHVFSTLALAAIASAGLVAGLQPSRGAEKAEAADSVEKSIWIEIGNNCDWNGYGSGYKIALAVWGGSAGDHWSDFHTLDGSNFIKVDYSAYTDDTGMNIYLFAPSVTEKSWSNRTANTNNVGIVDEVTIWDSYEDGGKPKHYVTDNYRDVVHTAELTDDLDGVELTTFGRDGDNYFQLEAKGISVTNGQKFKVSFDGDDYANLNSYVNPEWFDTTTNTGYITAKATGNFDFYFKTKRDAGEIKNELYVEENAEVAAVHFAETFVSDMETICGTTSAEWDVDHSGESLNTMWAKHKGLFEALTPAGKTAFNSGSSDAMVVRARKLYTHTAHRYSLDSWTGCNLPVSEAFVPFAKSTDSFNSTTIVAIVVASIMLTTVAAVLILRKKKEN